MRENYSTGFTFHVPRFTHHAPSLRPVRILRFLRCGWRLPDGFADFKHGAFELRVAALRHLGRVVHHFDVGVNAVAFDAQTNLLAHFPCSIAARVEKRPAGELHVSAVAPNPDYTFNPEVFPESPEAQQLKTKLVLPPGPNNPVGTAWISLDKPGYGMHGTPSPEQVGRTESHGCFRLANWNAEHLLKLVAVGTPVFVEP